MIKIRIKEILEEEGKSKYWFMEQFNGYLDILNNGTDTLWNNLEKVSQSGTEAVLEGVETAPIKMMLNGNTSQDGEPTPDTPVEVKVVKGENVVSVSGKNLYDVSLGFRNGYLNTDTGDFVSERQSFVSNQYIEAKENTKYTWSTNKVVKNISVYSYDENENYIKRESIIYDKNKGTITTSQNAKYIVVGGNYNGSSTITASILESLDIQIEEGSTATPYVPYSKTDYPINLGTLELCKINNYNDFPFKAINGNEYYDSLTEKQKNALVYGKWFKHKEIEKIVLDGNEEWSKQFGINLFNLQHYLDDKLPVAGYGLSNYYKYNSVQSGIDVNTSNGEFALQLAYGGNVFIKNTDYSTKEEFKSWLSTHNTKIYYPLATPTEEEITNSTLIEQLEAIYKAKSVKDKTFITQTNDELPFILDVEAIKEYSVE